MSDLEKANSWRCFTFAWLLSQIRWSKLSLEHWKELAKFCREKNILPLVDLAYQGFGDGINDDVKGLRYMASNLQELCIGISCSKTLVYIEIG